MRSYTPLCKGFLTGFWVSATPATPQLVDKYTMHSPRPINGEVSCSRCSHGTTRRIAPQLKYQTTEYYFNTIPLLTTCTTRKLAIDRQTFCGARFRPCATEVVQWRI